MGDFFDSCTKDEIITQWQAAQAEITSLNEQLEEDTARAEGAEQRAAENLWAAEELAADLMACAQLLAQAQSDLADERDRLEAAEKERDAEKTRADNYREVAGALAGAIRTEPVPEPAALLETIKRFKAALDAYDAAVKGEGR